jgi:hypothetical protein
VPRNSFPSDLLFARRLEGELRRPAFLLRRLVGAQGLPGGQRVAKGYCFLRRPIPAENRRRLIPPPRLRVEKGDSGHTVERVLDSKAVRCTT